MTFRIATRPRRAARHERMSAGLSALPADWRHGEPIRVGDKVVFTGCDDTLHSRLEAQCEKLGVRIIGNVSPKTAMLITDGTMDGTKAAKARDLGTRTVHPGTYTILLEHLQPALTRAAKAVPKSRPAPAPKHAATDANRVPGE